MGYELHISRNPEWWGKDGGGIELDEWLHLVAERPDLEATSSAGATTPNGVRVSIPSAGGLARWTAHPAAAGVLLDYRRGRIVVNGPDDPTIGFMVELAASLGAMVFGDEGESYP